MKSEFVEIIDNYKIDAFIILVVDSTLHRIKSITS